MHHRHWEDFTPEHVSEYGPQLITPEDIVAFAATFDPQPMHLDAEAASISMLGGLAGSGWHGCCLIMRMISDGFLLQSHFMGSAGVEEVRWLAPLRAGSTVVVRATVLGTHASHSRPEMGFVSFLFELLDTAGTRVMSMRTSLMFGRRASGPRVTDTGCPAS